MTFCGLLISTRGNFAANDRAGDDFATIDHRGNDHDVEAVFFTETGEQAHVAGLLMAKPEIFVPCQ